MQLAHIITKKIMCDGECVWIWRVCVDIESVCDRECV